MLCPNICKSCKMAYFQKRYQCNDDMIEIWLHNWMNYTSKGIAFYCHFEDAEITFKSDIPETCPYKLEHIVGTQGDTNGNSESTNEVRI